ncbi:MAG: hypothetical protein Q9222_004362 [Ikaeria aurantiellina]
MSLSSCAHTLRLPPTPPDCLDELGKEATDDSIGLALHVLKTERDALTNLHDLYQKDSVAQSSFKQAVSAIGKSSVRNGRAIVCGVGKSGKIGQKFVATLNSFGIRSAFLHPTEAMHGDLGMIGTNDTIVILSYSGRTAEILSILPHLPPGLPLIGVTSYPDFHSCPLFTHRPTANCILLPAPIPCSELELFGVPAPTSSTTTAMALTDALALALAHQLHPDPLAVFHRYHPGGAIGASASRMRPTTMSDLAVYVEDIPMVAVKAQRTPTILDGVLTAASSTSGWIRVVPDKVIAPRQIQSIGRARDLSHPLHLLVDGVIVEKGDWISIPAVHSVQQARKWIRQMRKSSRGRSFLKVGTVLGIVDGQ